MWLGMGLGGGKPWLFGETRILFLEHPAKLVWLSIIFFRKRSQYLDDLTLSTAISS